MRLSDRKLQRLITTAEQNLHFAPSGFTEAVMCLILSSGPAVAVITPPVLSRRLCAAVCFCTAAAILLFALMGVDVSTLNESLGSIAAHDTANGINSAFNALNQTIGEWIENIREFTLK
ncbi:MAG: hypothetical protein FWD35_05805 [Oscillospiraceae bacterium]|nr:hypothetical protein [Oscillospiraceae bacterium]